MLKVSSYLSFLAPCTAIAVCQFVIKRIRYGMLCHCFLPTTATDVNFTLPSCFRRPVCDRYNPMIHTLTAPGHGNAICSSQSTHQQTKSIKSQYTFLQQLPVAQNVERFLTMGYGTFQS